MTLNYILGICEARNLQSSLHPSGKLWKRNFSCCHYSSQMGQQLTMAEESPNNEQVGLIVDQGIL